MNTKETPNHFDKMSYLQDFGCMCGDDKFMDKQKIKEVCHCPDLVKKSCLALCDMLKIDNPNKEQIIIKFIEITKEHLKSTLFSEK